MIELDVETKRKTAVAASDVAARYLILGDFGMASGQPIAVDRDNLNEVLAAQEVSLAGGRMREIEDFHPDRLYQRLDAFHDLREEAAQPESPPPPRSPASPKPDLEKILRPGSLLEQIVEGGDPFEQYVRELAQVHAAPRATPDTRTATARCERMRALLRHPRFQAIEAAWRGLDFVVRQIDDDTARVHIAQYSKDDLSADLLEATDLKATRTYDLFRAHQWQGVFGLYAFGGVASDMELLGTIALLAANSHTSFVAEAAADMGPHWEELRSIPEAGHLGLALPRFLLRLPYGARTSPIESFEFEEMPNGPIHSAYLWGNPALACLAMVSRGKDLELENLPLHTYEVKGQWTSTPCAEALMSESEVEALVDLGLMPLVSFRDTDKIRLAGCRAINGETLPLIS